MADGVTLHGTDAHEELFGTLDDDTIFGGLGHDVLHGEAGDDTLDGGGGHDRLYGGAGRDVLSGGDGHDILEGGAGRDTLRGNAGFDILDGSEDGDTYLVGLDDLGFVDDYRDSGTSGRDVIRAVEDGTVIGLISGFSHASSGIEVITANGFANVTIGGTNDAEVYDFTGVRLGRIAMIATLDGHDTVTGNEQNNRIDLGAGHDVAYGMAGNDRIWGGDGNDVIEGGAGRDRLDGGAGHDILDGGTGRDIYVFDTSGNGYFDTVTDSGTDDGVDTIIATEAGTQIGLQDVFGADDGIEVITGKRLEDVTLHASDAGVNWDFSSVILRHIASIDGGDGMDTITGSAQRDTIDGGAGSDTLDGGANRDTLHGGADSDFLFGGEGRDTLFGDSGNDVLTGGLGNDVMTGGAGYDTFVFAAGDGRDRVTDFTSGEDLIDLSAFGELDFGGLDIRDTANGARIRVGDNVILLEGVAADDLSMDDFLFSGEFSVPLGPELF